jgi:uncharacterized membrane protein (DUF485 family)
MQYSKIYSLKGIVLFIALLLFTSLAGYTKTTYLDYLEVSAMSSSLNIGIMTIQYSFIISLVLTLILIGLNKAILFDSLADTIVDSLLN